MQNLRTLRQRIRSVQNTQKITKAMQMVAGAKLRRMQGELLSFRPYADSLEKMTQRFLSMHPGVEHPLLESPVMVSLSNHDQVSNRSPFGKLRAGFIEGRTETVPPAGLLVITSDTGLCGTYNERVMGEMERFHREFPSLVAVTIGKKGTRVLARKGIRRAKEIVHWGGRYQPEQAMPLLAWLEERYLDGEVSSWSVAYTQFISALAWRPTVELLLPVERSQAQAFPEKVIVEPDLPRFLDELLKQYGRARFARILLEAFTSEHSARMVAMKNATENAGEMIDTLTLVRNKVRQAAITKELIEVVSGAEALK